MEQVRRLIAAGRYVLTLNTSSRETADMDRELLILQNFAVMVPTGVYDSGPHQGENKPDRRVSYSKGMVINEADVPEGQSADDWIAKGLAEAAE